MIASYGASLHLFRAQEVDGVFIAAVSQVMNETDIRVLDTWMGLDKATLDSTRPGQYF